MDFLDVKKFRTELKNAAKYGIEEWLSKEFPGDGIVLHEVDNLRFKVVVNTRQGPVYLEVKVSNPWS